MKKFSLIICLLTTFVLTGCVQSNSESSKVPDFKKRGWYKELLSRIEKCAAGLSVHLISPDLVITVFIEFNKDGSIKRIPFVDTEGGTATEIKRYGPAMVRAVKRCGPYKFLPKHQYNEWSRLSVKFIPHEMFN